MPLGRIQRIRFGAILCLPLVVAVGYFARSKRAGADTSTLSGFLATYAGDALWAVMFYLIGRIICPRMGCARLGLLVLGFTLAIEFAQILQWEWLQWARAQPVLGFLLGNAFVWSDVACLLLGTVLAGLTDMAIGRSRPSTDT